MPDDTTMPNTEDKGDTPTADAQASVAAPVVSDASAGQNTPAQDVNYDGQTLAELTANAQATEAMFLAGLQALDGQINNGHPEIEDAAARKATELMEREQRVAAREQLAEFRTRSAMLVAAYKQTGLPVATLINLARGATSAADFQAQVATLVPAPKPAAVTQVAAPTASSVPASEPVDSGMNQGTPPKAEVWRSYDPADKILYAFLH